MNERTPFAGRSQFLARLETVKHLQETDFETYEIVRDRDSGQHYLRYSFIHINLSEGGRRDEYDHFLPLASDDVLGIILGDQPYSFPDHWRVPYLRSGNDERLMWFDPRENHGLNQDAEEERAIWEALKRYKREWAEAADQEELTRRLFAELDARRKQREQE